MRYNVGYVINNPYTRNNINSFCAVFGEDLCGYETKKSCEGIDKGS